MYPILTYDANTHNMYASYGGNDTDTTAIAELGGVSKTMYMRPDLVLGNDGTSYAEQVALINSFKKGEKLSIGNFDLKELKEFKAFEN